MGHPAFVHTTHHFSGRFRLLGPSPESAFALERERSSKSVEISQGFLGVELSGGLDQDFGMLLSPVLKKLSAEFVPTREVMIEGALGLGHAPTKLVDRDPLSALSNQNL